MTLQLIKVEDGMCNGEVLHHELSMYELVCVCVCVFVYTLFSCFLNMDYTMIMYIYNRVCDEF